MRKRFGAAPGIELASALRRGSMATQCSNDAAERNIGQQFVLPVTDPTFLSLFCIRLEMFVDGGG